MHLNEVKTFKDASHQGWLNRLFALNVRHVEQLGSLLAAPEGRHALLRLKVPVEAAHTAIQPVLEEKFGLSLFQPLKANSPSKTPLLTRATYPMGFEFAGEDRDPFRDAAFDSPLPEPPRPRKVPQPPEEQPVDGRASEKVLGEDNPFRAEDQGSRGTCVAFTAMGMYQLMCVHENVEVITLSPQYLYYRTKLSDAGDQDEEGTSLDAALRVLKRFGCCLHQDLDYHPRHDIPQQYRVCGHSPRKKEQVLKDLAKENRIGDYRPIAHTVDAVKAELVSGRAVGLGLAVYQLAWYNQLARREGEIALPPMDATDTSRTILDNYLGGHAVVVVGYRDNSVEDDEEANRPGGGYFIFRNSWGEDWAKANEFARGYGFLPYEYLERFCMEAVVIDGFAVVEKRANAARKAGPAEKKKPRARKKQG
jgi:hypothetical protein